ncbi:hypothetical protein WJX84_011407 [Apatococcus fuscideae]|uniref:Uncharacterized protein n=1 Tax=Apatococcus fuscideae TaxID=2026836 RepID=A0AAW1T7I2_9CHLO
MFLAPTLIPRTVEDLTQSKDEETQLAKREARLEAQFKEVSQYRQNAPVPGRRADQQQDEDPDMEGDGEDEEAMTDSQEESDEVSAEEDRDMSPEL